MKSDAASERFPGKNRPVKLAVAPEQRQLRDQAHQAKLASHLQTLDQEAELVAIFQPYATGYTGFFYHDQVYGPANDVLYRRQPGPEIRIYRLR